MIINHASLHQEKHVRGSAFHEAKEAINLFIQVKQQTSV
jgi:hypothetical protein